MRYPLRAGRTVAVILTAALVVLFGAPAADAHSILISSTPAKNSSITTAPGQVVLDFNEPLNGGFTELTVIGPDGVSHWEASAPSIVDNTVSARLRPLGPAGAYTIHYRVVSADGHPVSGAVPFTLAVAGTGTPTTPPASTANTTATPASADESVPVWPWVAGAVLALAAGLALARRVAR